MNTSTITSEAYLEGNGLKVLLLDDDETFCKLFQKIAEKRGIAVDYVLKAKQVDKIPLLEDYNAVWIDYDLDETTGLEVAEKLNLNHPDIPVVMVSSTNRVFSKDGALENIKASISKWELTEDSMEADLISSTIGDFDFAKSVHQN
ncbi:MAG: response regulator [Pseudobacteriovorax sp.]|nr:response regulator [Pseudobacteriovorax sp.]